VSRPASLRPSSSPILAKKKQTGGKKLELDWEQIELSDNHKMNTQFNIMDLRRLQRELQDAETSGRDSAAKKIRRQISRMQENQLAIHHTWCGGCGNYLHNCRCGGIDSHLSKSTQYRRKRKEKEAIDIVHRILQRVRDDIDQETSTKNKRR
jgi:hypothetical protein